ncbi:hypothetical protein PAXINDRAFT_16095 [Paxillus involutus ATCC 200175]|uniref:Uncharacterized protein n=1 Tax=Paxillus involutus ATCC 200175 TaxID=664439 RepID=A0A0C9TJU1_PAXIN|nr:hypothetical protein PAXINDRAFT_16095 [Paxillus involutus ATCC 200175]
MSTPAFQTPHAAATSQNVTLLPIPELFDPDFIDLLFPALNALRSTAQQKLTTNAAPAFDSTLIPTLHAFLGLDTSSSYWTGTRLSIHDGKGDKELFYRAFGWLFENHPRTAVANFHCLVDRCAPVLHPKDDWSRAERFANVYDHLTRKLLDKRHLALYVAVARLFAVRLTKDFAILEKSTALPGDTGEKERMKPMGALSLVSSIGHKIDLSPTRALPALEMHLLRWFYQRHVLTPRRRYTCVPEPLMLVNRWSEITCSQVSSVCMYANKEIFFTHDAERFLSYLTDVESGEKQISGATLLPHLVMQAKRTVDLIGDAMREQRRKLGETQPRVVDVQWATLLARLREAGELDDCIASPFEVDPIWPALSLSLSLVLARLAKPSFADSFITFSSQPRVVVLDPASKKVPLGETIQVMMHSDWGMNTDLNAVFLKLILPLAIKNKVPKDEMIKRVFVFSDMHNWRQLPVALRRRLIKPVPSTER